MRWDRGFRKAKCPRCRAALGDDLACPEGHGAFVPQGAAGADPPPHRPFTGDEPSCPGCMGPMDTVLEVADELLLATCARCEGAWTALGDLEDARRILRS